MNCLPPPLSLPVSPKPVRAVLDTDTYNEIDDQFALVYALLSPERIALEAVYAAPFHCPALNSRSTSPADGMESSYAEIHRILERMPLARPPVVFRGAPRFLSSRAEAVRNPASLDLVRRAHATPPGETLCVFSSGVTTNVASALLIDPSIAPRITVVWLGGNPHDWHDGAEFNLRQDVFAAQVLLESGTGFVQIPCKNIAEHLRTTVPEMAAHVRGRGAIGDYLYKIFSEYENAGDRAGPAGWSKPLWDIACVAVAIVPEAFDFVPVARPMLTDDMRWLPAADRGTMVVARDLKRDLIYADLFARLAAAPAATRPGAGIDMDPRPAISCVL
ncbi:MAG TPA: nucleoside hydrolase [Opitutaceae bacterium]|nr:nucleoside hydrolase [Opitutaceae bacterium]